MRSDLRVFTARANPLRWQQPHKHYLAFAEAMLDFGVTLTVIECQYGDRPFACELPHVRHIGVRATTPVWSKENLLNLAIRRTPEAANIMQHHVGFARQMMHGQPLAANSKPFWRFDGAPYDYPPGAARSAAAASTSPTCRCRFTTSTTASRCKSGMSG